MTDAPRTTGTLPTARRDARRDAQREQRLTDEQVEALAPYGRELRLEAGERLFDESAAVDSFYVILEGEIGISRLDGAEETPLITHGPNEFTGGLAVLTGKRSIHRGRATVPTHVREIDAETFRRVSAERPDVADVFISGLSRRMRETQRAFRGQEKMAALGKLAAGLAHELNNPAAAARRTSEEMGGAVLRAQNAALRHDRRFSEPQKQALSALLRGAAGGDREGGLDPLERSDREDEVAVWLEDRGVEGAWDLSPALVGAGLDAGTLAEFTGGMDGEVLAGAMGWLGTTLELVGLAEQVRTSAGRISELVGAIKEHTYMDRASHAETDVREGLEATLTVLGHRLAGVEVGRDYDPGLPRIWAHAGELNQVWTELLDNAADAVSDGAGVAGGKVVVKAYGDGEDAVVVEVADDGPGIPREARGRVFEPFFTTKGVGEGTGLGLDVARRVVSAHGGEISFDSAPGETRFVVRLPVGEQHRGEER